jgi:uncharacterized protein Veg
MRELQALENGRRLASKSSLQDTYGRNLVIEAEQKSHQMLKIVSHSQLNAYPKSCMMK